MVTEFTVLLVVLNGNHEAKSLVKAQHQLQRRPMWWCTVLRAVVFVIFGDQRRHNFVFIRRLDGPTYRCECGRGSTWKICRCCRYDAPPTQPTTENKSTDVRNGRVVAYFRSSAARSTARMSLLSFYRVLLGFPSFEMGLNEFHSVFTGLTGNLVLIGYSSTETNMSEISNKMLHRATGRERNVSVEVECLLVSKSTATLSWSSRPLLTFTGIFVFWGWKKTCWSWALSKRFLCHKEQWRGGGGDELEEGSCQCGVFTVLQLVHRPIWYDRPSKHVTGRTESSPTNKEGPKVRNFFVFLYIYIYIGFVSGWEKPGSGSFFSFICLRLDNTGYYRADLAPRRQRRLLPQLPSRDKMTPSSASLNKNGIHLRTYNFNGIASSFTSFPFHG